MIDLYFSPTPNGLKVRLFLEEARVPYRVIPVRLGKGEQHAHAFSKVSPNNKIPAIVDSHPEAGGAPLAVFESGAILLYLAEKTGLLLALEPRVRIETLQWLFWQVAGLGPMGGQSGHFNSHAPEHIPYAISRYTKEMHRLLGVLDRRLEARAFIAGEYSIADIAAYPWIAAKGAHRQDLMEFPNLARWFDAISVRPATRRVYRGVEDVYAPSATPMSDEERRILYGKPAA